MLLTKAIITLLFVLYSSCDVVYLSPLSPEEAQDQARVNLTQLYPNETPNRISYSGYITINQTLTSGEDINYFMWFIEAKNRNSSVPLLIWLQGGPGCSLTLGFFYENGPYKIVENTSYPLEQQLTENAYSWANDFHMLYIDNPFGTGFSYGPKESYATNETTIATYLYNTVEQFLQKFPGYQNNLLYIFGESYAGKYIPAFGSYIQARPNGLIKLRGMGIGNGSTNPYIQVTVVADMAYNIGFVDEENAEVMRYYQNLTRKCINEKKWEAAYNARESVYNVITVQSGGINLYDYRTYTKYKYSPIVQYINQEQVRDIIHAGNRTFDDMCNNLVADFLTADAMESASEYLPPLLDQYPMLFYQGQYDLRDSVASVQALLRNITWSGIPQYLVAPRHYWKANGVVGGMTRFYSNLYQCTVVGAGHLVPHDQGAASLEMVRRFVYQLTWQD